MCFTSYILAEVSSRAAEEWRRPFLLNSMPAYTFQTSVSNLETRYNSSHCIVCMLHYIEL